jgi:hypothetical protein
LLYIVNATRPDIAYSVGVLSRFRNYPTTSHWNEALRVLRYLKGTRSHGIVLGVNDEEVVGFVDSDGSGDLDGRKSTSGYVFHVYGGLFYGGVRSNPVLLLPQSGLSLLLPALRLRKPLGFGVC